jgi:thioredoxin reductase
MQDKFDVVIVGAGQNGMIAAAYPRGGHAGYSARSGRCSGTVPR